MTAREQILSEISFDTEAASLEAIFEQYSGYVARIGMRVLGRNDEIDDLVQDVFIAAFKGISGLKDPGAVKGWLATVTVRKATRRLQLRRLKRMVSLDSVANYRENATKGATAEQKMMLANVYEVLDDLPAKNRVAWTLRHIEGEQLKDVARLSECSLATAKRRIEAAHSVIKSRLNNG